MGLAGRGTAIVGVRPKWWRRQAWAVLFAVVCLVYSGLSAQEHAPDFEKPKTARETGVADPKRDARVESLLRSMTLDEKIGQLVQYSAGQPTGPGTGRSDYKEMIARGQIGALLNVIETPLINEYQRIAIEKSRLHIPLLFGLDVLHGFRTEFPIPLGMASTWDPDLVEKAARVAASEASAIGIQWTFTPMVDIARDARWGRIAEGAGEDPYLGAAMARAQVHGFQGAQIGPDSVLACVKHFAGYGAADGGRDYDSSYVPEELMRNVYLVPFHAAEEAGAASFMSAYMDLNDVPASGNHWLLTDVLRSEWGFEGIVLSDAFAVKSLETHGLANDPEDQET